MKKNQAQPNIVFILSDDHGYWANGCYGNKNISTPNIDRLAKEGVRFTDFYCTSPVCSPARASLLTGKIPSQHGVHDWIARGCVRRGDYDTVKVSRKRYIGALGNRTDEDYKTVDPEERIPIQNTDQYKFIMHESSETTQYLENHLGYTDILAREGYRCGLIGKWHLGDSRQAQKGFDKWSVIGKGGCDYHLPDFYRDGKLEMGDEYITDTITNEGIEYMETCVKEDKPFYVGLHYTAPHSPWNKEDQPEDIWDSYDDCDFSDLINQELHPWLVTKRHKQCETKEGRQYILQAYYTAVTAMDKSIGQVIDRLDQLGIRENTLIVFTSDNGMNMGHHGIWGKGNGTYPQNMYDTSVKVPMIISQKGRVQEDCVSGAMLSHYDVMPTLLEYAGIDAYDKEDLPGQSFSSLLTGHEDDHQRSVVVFDEYGPVRMIRSKDFKYIHRYPDGPHELYNMVEDPEEALNLVDDKTHASILASMRNELAEWFEKYVNPTMDGAKLPCTGDGQLLMADVDKSIEEQFRKRIG